MHNIEVKIVGSLQEVEVLWVDLGVLGDLNGAALEMAADHVPFAGEGRSVLQRGCPVASPGSNVTIGPSRGLFIEWPTRVC
jgi:hypothetical protein